jgi:polyhydroxybutyrate depolymerase
MRKAALCTLLFISFAPAAFAEMRTREFTLRTDGRVRSYLVHAPVAEGAARLPLVIVLHGGGGNARQAMHDYGMNTVAARERFIVAYPNGSGRLRKSLLTWNAGNCCAHAMRQEIDDVAFLRAMVEKIGRDFTIDRSRIYATGMSNGAMMAYRLGCEASDLFAAIAPVAGALNIDCRPSEPVAVLIFHGTADLHVPCGGGVGPKALERRVDQPVAHAVEIWQTANGCTRAWPPVKRGSIVSQRWTGCREGTTVTLYTIEGGGHAWPGAAPPRLRGADVPTQEISASETIWQFFAAHAKL